MMEFMPFLLFICICLVLVAGYPVAFSLAGTSLAFAGIGILTGTFDASFLTAVLTMARGTYIFLLWHLQSRKLRRNYSLRILLLASCLT